MGSSAFLKFLVGGATVPILLVASFCAVPKFPDDLSVPEPDAVLWRPGAPTVARLPFHRPLSDPQLRTANDGTIFAFGHHDDGAERLDARELRLVPAPDPGGDQFPTAPAHGGWDGTDPYPLDRGTWLVIERRNPGEVARTAICSRGQWVDGPALPLDGWTSSASLIEGATIAVTESPDAGGELFLGRVGEQTFRRVPLHGSSWKAPSLVGTDGARLFVVRTSSDPTDGSLTTRVVDARSGEVTEGPSLALPAGQRAVSVSGQSFSGGLVFAATRRVHAYDRRWLIPNILSIAVLIAGAAGLVRFRRRGGLTLAFFIGAAVSSGVIGFAASIFVAGMRGLAHM